MDNSITIKEIEFVSLKLPKKKISGTGEFYQTIKEDLTQVYTIFSDI